MKFIRFVQRVFVLIACLGFLALGVFALRTIPEPDSRPVVNGQPVAAAKPQPLPKALPPTQASLPALGQTGDCGAATAFASAASDNGASLTTLSVSPFGLPETGWAAYAPLVAREIGTACAPQTSGFASSLAAWQSAHALAAAGGRMDTATLARMSTIWLLRRPFVVASQKGCPASPAEATLARADPGESYGGKKILARPGALAAYRQMVQAAQQALGQTTPQLKIASAYRGPVEEALRCLLGGCHTAAKARCSAHRTGLAFDFYLGPFPGSDGFSTQPASRLYLSQTPTYRWLVNNADRFGFVNYPYEPWHWEWTGEPL